MLFMAGEGETKKMKQRMTYYFSILLLALIAVFPSTAAADSASWTVKSFQIYEADLTKTAADKAWGVANEYPLLKRDTYILNDNLWIGWQVELRGYQQGTMEWEILVEFVDPDGKKLSKTSFGVRTNSYNQKNYSAAGNAFLHPTKAGDYKIRVLVKNLFKYELIEEKTFTVFSQEALRAWDQKIKTAMENKDNEALYSLLRARDCVIPYDYSVCLNLGFMEAKGIGTPKDEENGFKRIEWLAKNIGTAEAQRMLGEMYYWGVGVGRNRETGETWTRKAAAQGDQQAQKNLEFFAQVRQEEAQAAAEEEAAAAQRAEQRDLNVISQLAVGMTVEVIRWHSDWRNVDYGYIGIVRELDGPYAVLEVTDFYNVNSYVEGGPATGGSDLYKNSDVGRYVRIRARHVSAIVEDS